MLLSLSVSGMKKSLKIIHDPLSTKLCGSPTDFIFSIYYHRVTDLIESKIYKAFAPNPKNKPPQMCGIFFENKGVEFVNIARVLRDPDIDKFLPSSSVKFRMPMVTYKLTALICT